VGSHVVQQLAFLGVLDFVLVDGDVVSLSNLNRLVGATEADVDAPKVDVAKRVVTAIQPDARLSSLDTRFDLANPPTELSTASVIFGCVDSDPIRLAIVRWASAFALPYIDIASDVSPAGEFGGRVVFALDGERCLSCSGELDQHELARADMSEEQRIADDRIYGVKRASLRNTGPSVVSINGVVASLAVTEFMVWITGLRRPKGYINYRGDLGTVGTRADPPRSHCHYCMGLWGSRNPKL
jgi:molybdopterin/thiamine biosynthesis adenylyltransferase